MGAFTAEQLTKGSIKNKRGNINKTVNWLNMLKPVQPNTFMFAVRLDNSNSKTDNSQIVLDISDISNAKAVKCPIITEKGIKFDVCPLNSYPLLSAVALRKAVKEGVLIHAIKTTLEKAMAKQLSLTVVNKRVDKYEYMPLNLMGITKGQVEYVIFQGDLSILAEYLKVPNNKPLYYCVGKTIKDDKPVYGLISSSNKKITVGHNELRQRIKDGKVYVINMHIANNGHLILDDF